jgi:translation initiation factor IF-3
MMKEKTIRFRHSIDDAALERHRKKLRAWAKDPRITVNVHIRILPQSEENMRTALKRLDQLCDGICGYVNVDKTNGFHLKATVV